jgi:hypothetical protein
LQEKLNPSTDQEALKHHILLVVSLSLNLCVIKTNEHHNISHTQQQTDRNTTSSSTGLKGGGGNLAERPTCRGNGRRLSLEGIQDTVFLEITMVHQSRQDQYSLLYCQKAVWTLTRCKRREVLHCPPRIHAFYDIIFFIIATIS